MKKSALIAFSLLMAACSTGMSQDEVDAAIEEAVAEATSTTSTTTTQAPPTTAAVTTTAAPNPADVALPYFRAIYLRELDEADVLSTYPASRFVDFLFDLKSFRGLELALSAGASIDVTVEGGNIRYCESSMISTGILECFVVSDIEVTDEGLVKRFAIDGEPLDDILKGPFDIVPTTGIGSDGGSTNRADGPGIGFGDEVVEFIVRPRWAFEGPAQSVIILEMSTDSRVWERGALAWINTGQTPIDADRPADLIPLGYQAGSHLALPFATASGETPLTYRVGIPSDTGTLYELAFPQGTNLDSFEVKLSPFVDGIVSSLKIDFIGNGTSITNSLMQGKDTTYVEEFLDDSYADCDQVEPDALVKAPRSFNGECIFTYAAIWQYDSSTGQCSFLADINDRKSTRTYDYDQTAWFGFGSDPNAFDQERTCLMLDGIDENDIVEVWAAGAGTFSYDTTGGASATVPALSILRVEVVKKG